MKAQRLRFRFRLTEASDLRPRDIVQAWAEAAGAACLDLSYSEGKRPAPQISLAVPLPTGVTSDCEIVDIFLETATNPAGALEQVKPHLPPGIEAHYVSEVGVGSQSAQSAIRWAEYEVTVPADGVDEAEAQKRIDCLMSQSSLPFEYRREAKVRTYDLRPLVLDLRLIGYGGDGFTLSMTLRAEQEKAGRADQVVLALRLPKPTRIHRKRLGLVAVPPVIVAYRRAGERED